jgi:polysaccharide export outer membrane protein
MLRILALTIIAFGASLQISLGQAVPSQAQPTPLRTTFPNAHGLSQDYRVGSGDTLEIQVVDAPDLNQTLKVSTTGEINFLSLGAVSVKDLTAAEIETKIGSALKERKLVQDPQILAYIKGYQAKRIYLIGELAFPGEFVMSQNLTVMDAILLAGGLGASPVHYGYLHRHTSKGESVPPPENIVAKPETPRQGTDIYKIDLMPLLKGKSPEPDLLLKEGDYLIIPRRDSDLFFVLGEVTNPYNYAYPEGRVLTLSQAIAQAGGPTTAAKASKVVISRKDENGNRSEMYADFSAILMGKQKDIEIRPNDIVFVPSGKLTMIKEQYITTTDLFAEGTAFRIGRYYQMQAAQQR